MLLTLQLCGTLVDAIIAACRRRRPRAVQRPKRAKHLVTQLVESGPVKAARPTPIQTGERLQDSKPEPLLLAFEALLNLGCELRPQSCRCFRW
jgi:hypothetical protein